MVLGLEETVDIIHDGLSLDMKIVELELLSHLHQ